MFLSYLSSLILHYNLIHAGIEVNTALQGQIPLFNQAHKLPAPAGQVASSRLARRASSIMINHTGASGRNSLFIICLNRGLRAKKDTTIRIYLCQTWWCQRNCPFPVVLPYAIFLVWRC